MEVAELFVKLGIDGDGKFINGLKKADQTLKSVASSSFLAKTGIGLMAVAILKAAQAASNFGKSLSFFESFTGISAESLQKFTYAGELAGIKAEETKSTFASLRKQMDEFAVSGEGPQWLNELAKGVDLDLDKAIKDTTYLFSKIQQYAANPAIDKMQKRLVLGSFGLSDNMTAAMMEGAFNKKAMNQAPIVSKEEIGILSQINAEFSKFSAQIKVAGAQLVAAFGKDLVGGIGTFMSGLYKAVSLIVKIAKESKGLHIILKAIGMAFEGWGYILEGITSIIDALFTFANGKIGSILKFISPVFDKIGQGIEWIFDKIFTLGEKVFSLISGFSGIVGKLFESGPGKFLAEKIFGNDAGASKEALQASASPVMSKSSVISSNRGGDDNRNVTINQTNNFTNADEAPSNIAKATSNAVNNSFKFETTAAMRAMIGTAGGV